MAGVTPYADKISQKDESFFLESMQEIDYLKDLNIKDHWSDKLSVNTKNAIWQYLQTLYMLGVTITSIPQETLGAIEKLAEDAASKLGGENMDQDALMQTMSNMLGGMLKK
jgi:maleate cis-trans isomerase